MTDQRQPKSNGALYFIVGGLVIAVAVVAYLMTGGQVPTTDGVAGSGSSDITIENNAAPEPAPAEAPDATEPAPAAPASATDAPVDP